MTIHFLTMGNIYSLTGGYLYNMRMIEGLEQKGYSVNIFGTDWPWNIKSDLEKISLFHFEKLAVGSCIIIDSLVLARLRSVVEKFSTRLTFIGLIHLPVSYQYTYGEFGRISHEELIALRQMKQLIVTGRFTYDLLWKAGLNAARIRVVEPGTDQFPRKTHYKSVPSELLCIANYSAIKAHDILIRSLSRLASRDWTLHLYGDIGHDKEYSSGIYSLIEQLHLEKRVIMHGIAGRDEITAIFLLADLFVMPSLFESYGMALTESLAHGVPVLTTRTGNIPHTVPPGMGILVEPGNEEELTHAIRSLMDEPSKYASLCSTASQYHYLARSWDQAVMEFERIIGETVKTL
jgi:glycosyltransferase involved in cell wall biosynthesis